MVCWEEMPGQALLTQPCSQLGLCLCLDGSTQGTSGCRMGLKVKTRGSHLGSTKQSPHTPHGADSRSLPLQMSLLEAKEQVRHTLPVSSPRRGLCW